MMLLKLTRGGWLRHFGMAVLENADDYNTAGSAAAGQVRGRECREHTLSRQQAGQHGRHSISESDRLSDSCGL